VAGEGARRSCLDRSGLDSLIAGLRERGFTVIGPTRRDDAIVYREIASTADLPEGWGDQQDGGVYRLHRRDDDALFGYAVGPDSCKRYLFPPEELLWKARRTSDGFEVEQPPGPEAEPPRYAFIGVRACDLAAIAVQDSVFLGSEYPDPRYASRRAGTFVVAANCGAPSGTCFCVSMGTGPKATSGFDLSLTEVLDDGRHVFVVEEGSAAGSELLATVPHRPATGDEAAAADAVVDDAAGRMGRHLETDGIRDLLQRNAEHPRWQEVAERCLACGNCTLACPTCFCSTVEDATDLTGDVAERTRRWDSCFGVEFSFMGGGGVRATTAGRYRQWMTHKLSTWHDQFDMSGCVGCGRCITWCPVGIDITEEARAIRESEGGG